MVLAFGFSILTFPRSRVFCLAGSRKLAGGGGAGDGGVIAVMINTIVHVHSIDASGCL